jgi:hypothetical protein
MMSPDAGTKATHSRGVGKQHINKSVFIDMIVLAPFCPILVLGIAWVLCRIFRDLWEGRQNRPQLRCGIASQTSTAPPGGAGKANRAPLGPVKARGEANSRPAAMRPGGRHMRSPNTLPGIFIRAARLRAPRWRTSSQK